MPRKPSPFALGYTEALNNAWQEVDKVLRAGGSDTDALDALLTWIGDNSGPSDASHEAASVAHARLIHRATDSLDRPLTGWTHPAHLPGVSVTTWHSDAGDGAHDGALVVQVDTEEPASTQRLRIRLNDGPVWDGIADTDKHPGRYFASQPVDPRVGEVLTVVRSELDMFLTSGCGQAGEDGTAVDAAADVAEALHRTYGVAATR